VLDEPCGQRLALWDNGQCGDGELLLLAEDRTRGTQRTRDEAKADVFDYIERFYNHASQHPFVYMSEEKRLC
jgi:hypothetical protein